MLFQRKLRWLGHVRRMNGGRIPKDLLYGEFSAEKRSLGRPQLRNWNVCKRDMEELSIEENIFYYLFNCLLYIPVDKVAIYIEF